MDYVVHACLLASFAVGYLIGRVDLIVDRLRTTSEPTYQPTFGNNVARKKSTKISEPHVASHKIDIDNTTVVTNIDTAGMQRSGATELGKTTIAQDDIQSSVSKLAQLKGK